MMRVVLFKALDRRSNYSHHLRLHRYCYGERSSTPENLFHDLKVWYLASLIYPLIFFAKAEIKFFFEYLMMLTP